MSQTTNRLADPFDAVLHLLDRQLIDVDGLLAGKVDDLELTEGPDGWRITAVLTGTTALLHRLGGRIGNRLVELHAQLRVTEPDRDVPWRIPITQVSYVDSAVHLDRARKGVLHHNHVGRRLGRLTGMRVLESGRCVGRVIDVHVVPASGRLVLESLVVGRGGPGSYLGYDRNEEKGPWLVRAIVRAWHRGTRTVPLSRAAIDWDAREVNL
ncbi:PRC-barrel domain-containing protein [Nocardioides montaniterrae]